MRRFRNWIATFGALTLGVAMLPGGWRPGVTIDPQRAGVTCAATLDVTTDAPLTVILPGCGGPRRAFG